MRKKKREMMRNGNEEKGDDGKWRRGKGNGEEGKEDDEKWRGGKGRALE